MVILYLYGPLNGQRSQKGISGHGSQREPVIPNLATLYSRRSLVTRFASSSPRTCALLANFQGYVSSLRISKSATRRRPSLSYFRRGLSDCCQTGTVQYVTLHTTPSWAPTHVGNIPNRITWIVIPKLWWITIKLAVLPRSIICSEKDGTWTYVVLSFIGHDSRCVECQNCLPLGWRGKCLLFSNKEVQNLTDLYTWCLQMSRAHNERVSGSPQMAAVVMALLGIGVSSFSVAQMSAVPQGNRRYFPRIPWNWCKPPAETLGSMFTFDFLPLDRI